MTEFPTGYVLNNRYRIVKRIGGGGFADIYRAWDLNLGRACAIKQNRESAPAAQQQFEQEAMILAKLSHPNLARVTDYFIIPGLGQYLVMDFIEGQDLQELLDRSGPMTQTQVLAWTSQVCSALTYLHAQIPPVIHRDIKPANIKITPEGKAVLVDFGIAKIYDPSRKTTRGARGMTPGFSPPEQYGQGRTDVRTDVYALGATLYTLLTGQDPPESVLISAGQANLLPVRSLNISVSTAVETAIKWAMNTRPEERYQDIAEFHAALYATQPTPPGSPAKSSRTTTPERKSVDWDRIIRRVGSFTLAVLGVAIVVVIIIAISGPTPTDSSKPLDKPTETKSVTLAPAKTSPAKRTPTAVPSITHIPTRASTIAPTPTLDMPRFDLAFASNQSGVFQVYLMDTRSPKDSLVLPNPKKYDKTWWPSFCGDLIAAEVQDTSGEQPQWIYLFDPESGDAQKWDPPGSPPALGIPRCSLDGSYLAYSALFGKKWPIYVSEISDGKTLLIYTSRIAGYASWPVGDQGFYFMEAVDSFFDIRKVSNISSSVLDINLVLEGKYPAISPDSTQLVFACHETYKDLCIHDLNSHQTRTLIALQYLKIDNKPMPANPAWSGDGRWIYFNSAADGDWDIYRIHPDGSGLENMTEDWGSSHELMPSLQW